MSSGTFATHSAVRSFHKQGSNALQNRPQMRQQVPRQHTRVARDDPTRSEKHKQIRVTYHERKPISIGMILVGAVSVCSMMLLMRRGRVWRLPRSSPRCRRSKRPCAARSAFPITVVSLWPTGMSNNTRQPGFAMFGTARFASNGQTNYGNAVRPCGAKCMIMVSVTGKYRGAADSKCNRQLRRTVNVPVIFRKYRGYSCRLPARAFGTLNSRDVRIIGQTLEKYMAVSSGRSHRVRRLPTVSSVARRSICHMECLPNGGRDKFRHSEQGFATE